MPLRRKDQSSRQSSRGVSRAMSWLMQLSASATARPPSLQSCALFTRPDWIRPRSVVCSVFATSRSQRGGEPVFLPWTTCRYALPPRPCNRRRLVHRFAEQDDGVAFVLEPLRGDVLGLLDEADDGNRGRRINRAGGALIVERAIAAGDGRVEGFATFRQAAHGFLDLPEQLGLERAGHVEIVRRAERQSRRSRRDCGTLRPRRLSRLRRDRDKRNRRCSPRSWRSTSRKLSGRRLWRRVPRSSRARNPS